MTILREKSFTQFTCELYPYWISFNWICQSEVLRKSGTGNVWPSHRTVFYLMSVLFIARIAAKECLVSSRLLGLSEDHALKVEVDTG